MSDDRERVDASKEPLKPSTIITMVVVDVLSIVWLLLVPSPTRWFGLIGFAVVWVVLTLDRRDAPRRWAERQARNPYA